MKHSICIQKLTLTLTFMLLNKLTVIAKRLRYGVIFSDYLQIYCWVFQWKNFAMTKTWRLTFCTLCTCMYQLMVAQPRGAWVDRRHLNEVEILPIIVPTPHSYFHCTSSHIKRAKTDTATSSVTACLGTKNYSIRKSGEVQFLPQNAPETVWRPGFRPDPLGEL